MVVEGEEEKIETHLEEIHPVMAVINVEKMATLLENVQVLDK